MGPRHYSHALPAGSAASSFLLERVVGCGTARMALAVAAVGARARAAVEGSESGYFLPGGGRLLVAIRAAPPLPGCCEDTSADDAWWGPHWTQLPRTLRPPPLVRSVRIGGEAVVRAWDDALSLADDSVVLPRAVAACEWWLRRCAADWAAGRGLPLTVRCTSHLADTVARALLCRLPAGAVASLWVQAVPLAADLTSPAAATATAATVLRLGPVLPTGSGAWYDGLEELAVLAPPWASAAPVLSIVLTVNDDDDGSGEAASPCGGGASTVPMVAPRLRRLLLSHAACVGWAGGLPSLEELALDGVAAADVSAWDRLAGLPLLRRLSVRRSAVPWLRWLRGCPRLEDASFHAVTGVKDWGSLAHCPLLRRLSIIACRVSQLLWLRGCAELQQLTLLGTTRLRGSSRAASRLRAALLRR